MLEPALRFGQNQSLNQAEKSAAKAKISRPNRHPLPTQMNPWFATNQVHYVTHLRGKIFWHNCNTSSQILSHLNWFVNDISRIIWHLF
jgi:hypothetical protein